jgi:hypothetical protein
MKRICNWELGIWNWAAGRPSAALGAGFWHFNTSAGAASQLSVTLTR